MIDQPRKGSLLVIFLTVFVDLLGFGIVLPLLPIYADQFVADDSGLMIGLLMASFSAMQFVFAPVWGRISDHVGRRPVLMIGLAGSVVFYALFGIATTMQSLSLLFVSRIGAGIAGATISTAQAYIADTTTVENRTKGMALIGMAFGMGFTFGPLFGFLAVPTGHGDPGPWPGYAAAILSAGALLLAVFKLPESKRADSKSAAHRLFDVRGLRAAVMAPSIGMLLVAVFFCVFSFANFETTLSMLIKGSAEAADQKFQFTWREVCLTYAYIGFTLALVQGAIVRRMSGRVREGTMCAAGAVIEIAGFALVVLAIGRSSPALLMVSLALVVTGFSFMQPNLNALLSRRTDPAKQGVVLGIGQSVSSLARILGSALGIPLLKYHLELPYFGAAGLMALGLILVLVAARTGKDYTTVSV